MPERLSWNNTGERLYEIGVDRAVLFVMNNGTYGKGVAWSGVTAINESPSGAEKTELYADNQKYLTLLSVEEFGGTIEAYMFPDEWKECDGSAEIAEGVSIGQQSRKTFGLAYRTKIGNDTEHEDHGYTLHIVYGAVASPSEQSNETINDSPDVSPMSWEFSTTPVNVTGHKPTSHIEIDSTKVDATKLAEFEDIIYGSSTEDSRIMMPDEIAAHFTMIGG